MTPRPQSAYSAWVKFSRGWRLALWGCLCLGVLHRTRGASAQSPESARRDAGALDAGPLDASDADDDAGRDADGGVDDAGRDAGGGVDDAGEGDGRSCAPGRTHGADGRCGPRPDDPRDGDAPVLGWLPRGAVRVPVGAGRVVFPGAVFRVGARLVSVGAFALGRTEVTVAQYGRCVAAGRCVAPPDPTGQMAHGDQPVVNVTHAMAARYCAWEGARLPTDAEFSLAAAGVEGRRFPWGAREADCTLAAMAGCTTGPRRVGSFAAGATPEGVMDLAGNVAEWVHDRPGTGGRPSVGTGLVRDPVGGGGGEMRVVRGGSFRSAVRTLTTAAREVVHEGEARIDLGFRCAQGL